MPGQLCLDKVCLHRRMSMQQYLEFILVVSSQNKAAGKAVVYQQSLSEHDLSFLSLLLPGLALSNTNQSDDWHR